MLYLQRTPPNEPPRRERWSFPRFQLLAARQRSFEAVASYSPASLTLSGQGEADAELVQSERVSPSYFRVLRAAPERGRLFSDAENDAAAPSPITLIGHDLWMRRFAGDLGLLGRTIRPERRAAHRGRHTSRGISAGLSGHAELWVPAHDVAANSPIPST